MLDDGLPVDDEKEKTKETIIPAFPDTLSNRARFWQMIFGKRRSTLDLLFKNNYHMKMGETGLPNARIFQPNEPHLVREVMVDDFDNYPKPDLVCKFMYPLIGASIFNVSGSQWREQRTMLNQLFLPEGIKKVYPTMLDCTQAMIEKFDGMMDNTGKINLDIAPVVNFTVADIIFRTLLATPLQPEVGKQMLNCFESFQKNSPLSLIMYLAGLSRLVKFLPSEWWRISRGNKIRRIIRQTVRPQFEAYRNQKHSDKHHDNLFVSLMHTRKQNGALLSLDEVVDQLAFMFLAGHETSASAITWALYLLALDQDTQEKSAREIIGLLGQNAASFTDLNKLELLGRVFQEALRLYPPVAFFPRQSLEERKMRGKNIKPGSRVIISPWAMQRNARAWECPHAFMPDRFKDTQNRDAMRHYYFPFGVGARICLGAGFAKQEAVLVLSSILQRYHITLEENFSPEPVGRLTIRSANGLRVILTKRET